MEIILPREPFDDAWSRCYGWLEEALTRGNGEWTMDDIREAILNGDMILWAMPNAAIVTQVLKYPRKSYLHCWLIGGKLEEVKDIEPQLISFAKFIGCDGLTGAGRAGWARAMGGNWKEFSRSFISEFTS